MTDRRRINGPAGGTAPPVFEPSLTSSTPSQYSSSKNPRRPTDLRRIFLKTGLTPSASGSAYLELEPKPDHGTNSASFVSKVSSLKLTCTVHGPRPLPRSASFTPNALLSAHIKFAPFATRERRGYLRDASERDLAAHLETALRGVIITDRWPKSGVEVIITVLEGEDDSWSATDFSTTRTSRGWTSTLGMMTILAGCITVASAAMIDAGLDCVDLASGGVAALARRPAAVSSVNSTQGQEASDLQIVLDPVPSECTEVLAMCVVGYLKSRDELTEVWMSGGSPVLPQPFLDGQGGVSVLIDAAVQAAIAARHVLLEAVKEAAELKSTRAAVKPS